MRATQVSFSRLFNTGNYENMKIEIQLEVAENEKASDVLTVAKKWVDQHGPNKDEETRKYEQAKQRLQYKGDLTLNQIERFEEIIKDYESAQKVQFDF